MVELDLLIFFSIYYFFSIYCHVASIPQFLHVARLEQNSQYMPCITIKLTNDVIEKKTDEHSTIEIT